MHKCLETIFKYFILFCSNYIMKIVEKMVDHKRSNTTCLPLRCMSNNLKHTPSRQQEDPKYKIIKSIGAGTFGKVYMVEYL